MPPILALILCIIVVAILLRIERRRNPDVSFALWVPTFWLLLCGSKPLGRWFGSGPTIASGAAVSEGSSLDRLALSILIALALLILFKRNIEWSRILRDNFWLILLYVYLASSILWSDFPFVSFKRWVRLFGTIPVAMVVLTERFPLKALESVLRRCAYVMIPFSLVLIKYFPDLGVYYHGWSGTKTWVGVATQKNALGVICSQFASTW
jgi:hypothetical protein